jgi:tRNA dimethylallyltransferase
MELARRWDAEILSVDSMQVYRGMDVGTAKPTALDRREIPHHMIDLVEPEQDYSVAEFQREGRLALQGVPTRAVIAGGSGLHFRALVDPMTFAPTDPRVRDELESEPLDELATQLTELDSGASRLIDLKNKRRVVRALEVARLGGGTPTERHESDEAWQVRRYEPELEFDAFGLDPGDLIETRLRDRLKSMIDGGLVAEVRRLSQRLGRSARTAIGYAEILDADSGRMSIEEAFSSIERNTLKLARRQRTWFQRDPRIRWIPWSSDAKDSADRIEELLT